MNATARTTAAVTPAAKSSVSEATSTSTKFSFTTNTTTYSTRQGKPQQQSQPLLKKPISHQDPNIEPLTSEKRNTIIFGDSIPKGINTRLLNTNLIKSTAISK